MPKVPDEPRRFPLRGVLSKSLQQRGWLGTLRMIIDELCFDLRFGTETLSPVSVGRLAPSAGPNVAYAEPYQAARWTILKEAFRSLAAGGDLDLKRACLVDFGSGKGRLLIAALHFKIPVVFKVVFDPARCRICRANLSKYVQRKGLGNEL